MEEKRAFVNQILRVVLPQECEEKGKDEAKEQTSETSPTSPTSEVGDSAVKSQSVSENDQTMSDATPPDSEATPPVLQSTEEPPKKSEISEIATSEKSEKSEKPKKFRLSSLVSADQLPLAIPPEFYEAVMREVSSLPAIHGLTGLTGVPVDAAKSSKDPKV